MNNIISKARFRDQRKAAAKRGIAFNLTYEQWYNWYLSQGVDKNIRQGKDGNCWCMCRFNDSGPYELGNIYLDTNSNNVKYQRALEKLKKTG